MKGSFFLHVSLIENEDCLCAWNIELFVSAYQIIVLFWNDRAINLTFTQETVINLSKETKQQISIQNSIDKHQIGN